MKLFLAALAATAAFVPVHGFAHGEAHRSAGKTKPMMDMEEQPYGSPGDPKHVSRTINVGMDDTMHFLPGSIQVKRGETIRFKVMNHGKLMHEMVLGTPEALKEHAELMRKFPDMEHEAPNMAHVPPGATEYIVWKFTRPGEYSFGCLVAGHFEAGMVGKIAVGA